jgi:hypothetical protein
MSKVFLLLMLMSTPNQPSIKYNGVLYFSEPECLVARADYIEAYNKKPQSYKDLVLTEAFCIPFNAFPLTTMNRTSA